MSNDAVQEFAKKKMVVGLLAILLPGLAIHKFMLGYTNTGIIQLVLFPCTCGLIAFVGMIEGIIYLTKSDEDFYQTYAVEKKQWF